MGYLVCGGEDLRSAAREVFGHGPSAARVKPPNTVLLTDAFHSALRAARGAAKRER